jgi:hypothetical protein
MDRAIAVWDVSWMKKPERPLSPEKRQPVGCLASLATDDSLSGGSTAVPGVL